MSVNLAVRQVRDALFAQAGGSSAAGTGQPSTALLGGLFHEVFAELVGHDPSRNWVAALDCETPDEQKWRQSLSDHAYRRLVAPRLQRHHASLHDSAEQVCLFWEAVQSLCDWVVELVWTVYQATGRMPEPQSLVQSECSLEVELRESGWADAVRLAGIADAIWRIPGKNAWCVAELKLGQTYEQADLGQACLYHIMLAAAAIGQPAGPLAVVSFKPHREERFYDAARLEAAQKELVNLIGQLAGVIRQPVSLPHDEHVVAPWQPTDEHLKLGKALIATLREYGAPAELAGPPIVGPTFLQFPLIPARGVRVAKITQLAEEIKVRLQLQEAPLVHCGRGQLTVDVQRPDRQIVRFDSSYSQLPLADSLTGGSQVPLGIDLNGRLQFADLAEPENCHVLVAGTTGSGKSEWLRAALAGLIATNTPQTLRLVLIDPKRNAFHELAGSPFLFEPIVYPDEQSPVEVFERLADEMDQRYRLLDGADSLKQYVARERRPLARIVCVCDEYFDLVNRGRQVRSDIEMQLFRLGAKARAAGIHLMIATQQPSRQTIKGALDSNIPARVALKTNKAVESRMLLGESGAERLLGNGDLLFKDIGNPRRLQGLYLPPEVRRTLFTSAANPSRQSSALPAQPAIFPFNSCNDYQTA